jgi:uncharacterized protein (TIGR00106 family)
MSVLIDFSIFPVDKGTSVSPYVARAVAIIKASGLSYSLGPMGTCIEGPWPAVMGVVHRCFENLQTDCERIYFTIKADYRKDAANCLQGKVRAVESKLE